MKTGRKWNAFSSSDAISRKGKNKENTVQAAKRTHAIYGDDAIAKSTVHKWFANFRNENFELEGRERSSRHRVIDDKTEIV